MILADVYFLVWHNAKVQLFKPVNKKKGQNNICIPIPYNYLNKDIVSQ